MKYKLVALDIDGTLINDDHKIPQENIDTIKLLQNKGVKFMLVTGRAVPMTSEYTKELDMKGAVIGCNGAITLDITTNKVLDSNYFDNDKLREIFTFFRSRDIHPRLYSADRFYSSNPDELNEDVNPFAVYANKMVGIMGNTHFDNIEELIGNDVKILKFIFPSTDQDKLLKVQKELKSIAGTESVRSAPFSIDTMRSGISKANALIKYANSIGINKEEIIAIGDSENDLHMLSEVGLPVTLENGTDKIKEISHMVFASNNDAGVSKALKKIFELE